MSSRIKHPAQGFLLGFLGQSFISDVISFKLTTYTSSYSGDFLGLVITFAVIFCIQNFQGNLFSEIHVKFGWYFVRVLWVRHIELGQTRLTLKQVVNSAKHVDNKLLKQHLYKKDL